MKYIKKMSAKNKSRVLKLYISIYLLSVSGEFFRESFSWSIFLKQVLVASPITALFLTVMIATSIGAIKGTKGQVEAAINSDDPNPVKNESILASARRSSVKRYIPLFIGLIVAIMTIVERLFLRLY